MIHFPSAFSWLIYSFGLMRPAHRPNTGMTKPRSFFAKKAEAPQKRKWSVR
jgi:hypothetical protein